MPVATTAVGKAGGEKRDYIGCANLALADSKLRERLVDFKKAQGKKGIEIGLGYIIKSVTYINKSHNKKFPKWGKIGIFWVFF